MDDVSSGKTGFGKDKDGSTLSTGFISAKVFVPGYIENIRLSDFISNNKM
jgi:hypothetical protein